MIISGVIPEEWAYFLSAQTSFVQGLLVKKLANVPIQFCQFSLIDYQIIGVVCKITLS